MTATVNNRVRNPQANVINGVDAGGMMSARIQAGYEKVMKSPPDGKQFPFVDRECQFVRGSVVSQDWVEAIALLTGTLGTKVFYEKKSGADTWVKHTLTNPIIHNIKLNITGGHNNTSYATVSYDFECRFADPTKTIADAWAMTDAQTVPTYVAAARGGVRFETVTLGALSIYHVTALSLNITVKLVKACNDADVGFTCVDAEQDGMEISGSLTFQDAAIGTNVIKAAQVILAARASLTATIRQSSGAASKVLTIAGVIFTSVDSNSDRGNDFSDYTANFTVANDATTELTLAGANKIVTFA